MDYLKTLAFEQTWNLLFGYKFDSWFSQGKFADQAFVMQKVHFSDLLKSTLKAYVQHVYQQLHITHITRWKYLSYQCIFEKPDP